MVFSTKQSASAFLFCSLALTAASAQTPDTAALRGVVTGPDGQPLAGVQVRVNSSPGSMERAVRTGGDGTFLLSGLPVGTALVLQAIQPGFSPGEVQHLVLEGGVTASVRMTLQLRGASTRIVVTGAADEVRADEPQLGDRLTMVQMRDTPLPNRRITYLPLLNAANRPAINQGDVFMNQDLFTSNGTGRRETWFDVDGANAVDMWGRQTIFTNVPLDAVAQMTVLENAFAADSGFGEGGVLNIVTRSGGNAFHGDVLALGRPAGPEAALSGFSATTATSGNDVASDTLLQGAASLSGPVTHDARTTVASSLEYSSQDRASPITSPIAPGSFVGHYRDWMGFLRVDHTFSQRNSGFLRGESDAFVDTNPNGIVGGNTLATVARTFHRRTFTAEAGDTAVLTPTLVNQARLQFQLASPITQFVPTVYGTEFVVPISSGGTYTSGTSQAALLLNHQYEVTDTLEKGWSGNTLRAGFEVIHARSGGNSKEFGGPIYDGEFQYLACTGTTAYCESAAYLDNVQNVQSYTQSYGNADYLVNDTLAGVFAQDDTHLTPDLTLNLGLRYELQTFTDARTNLAPRIGFAWNAFGRGITTVRGGFGIYYSQIVDNSEANYALTGPTGVFNYTAAPGELGFPTSVADAPLPAFPAGAVEPLRSLYLRPGRASYYNQFLPTDTLVGYPDKLLNPYNEQWTLGFDQQLAKSWVLSANYLGSHTVKIVRPLDVDAPSSYVRTAPGEIRSAAVANCTRPYWKAWFAERDETCDATDKTQVDPPYAVVQSDVNDGVAYYEAAEVNLSHHSAGGSSLLASYVYSHALDTVDPDVPSQNPNDPLMTGEAELGNAIFDQRHRFVLSGVYAAPFGIETGGVATLAGGLPYNVVTGVTNSGDTGATTDRPVIDGVVIGRDTGRGKPIYEVAPFVGKTLPLSRERFRLELRAEAFNVLNHRNVVGYSGTYGDGAAPGMGFGQPLAGVTNQLPARELQFSARVGF
jgi:hypothetical protein